jgi:hypothetical protein
MLGWRLTKLDILHRIVGDGAVLDHMHIDRHHHGARAVEERRFVRAGRGEFRRAEVVVIRCRRIEPHLAGGVEQKLALGVTLRERTRLHIAAQPGSFCRQRSVFAPQVVLKVVDGEPGVALHQGDDLQHTDTPGSGALRDKCTRC